MIPTEVDPEANSYLFGSGANDHARGESETGQRFGLGHSAMKLEAIYDNGRLEFIHPIHFVRDRLKVVVEVPDQEVVKPQDKAPAASLGRYAQALQTRLDAVRNAPLPPDDDLPEFTEKQRSRIETFAWRENR